MEDAEAVCFSTTEEPLASEDELSAHEIHEALCEYSLLETSEQSGVLRFRFPDGKEVASRAVEKGDVLKSGVEAARGDTIWACLIKPIVGPGYLRVLAREREW